MSSMYMCSLNECKRIATQSLPHFGEVSLQNRCITQDELHDDQSIPDQTQSTSPSIPQSNLLCRKLRSEIKAENHVTSNIAQTSLCNTYYNMCDNGCNNQITSQMAYQVTSTGPFHYQSSSIQYSPYHHRIHHARNRRNYLAHAYSSNYSSPPLTPTITQGLVLPDISRLQEALQQSNINSAQYITQQNYGGNGEQQHEIIANKQVLPLASPLQTTSQQSCINTAQPYINNENETIISNQLSPVSPLQGVAQQNNIYSTQQYVAPQNYVDNNNKQRSPIIPNNQLSPTVRQNETVISNQLSPVSPLQGVAQQNNIYSTQQYVAPQNYVDNNNEQRSPIIPNNQLSPTVRPLQENLQLMQENSSYNTQQYIPQQSYAGINIEEMNNVAISGNTSQNVQQQIKRFKWMEFRHNVGNADKRARKRQTYTRHQTVRLEQKFFDNTYLPRTERVKLSIELSLTEKQIKIWFQNRRMKAKKERLDEEQRKRLNGTHSQEQPIPQERSIIQQQQPIAQQPQLHQTHQNYQNHLQEQFVFPCAR